MNRAPERFLRLVDPALVPLGAASLWVPVVQWLRHLEARSYSPRTLLSYRSDLFGFIRWRSSGPEPTNCSEQKVEPDA